MRNLMLMYHEVHPVERPEASYPISVRTYSLGETVFREHLATIRDSGLRVLTVGEALAARNNAENSVVISFDDGWVGSLTRAVEMLAEANLRATFFITRDYIGRGNFATVDDLRRAAAMGMELGGHGTTHRYLGNCTSEEVRREFADVKKFLEDIVGRPVSTASVPGGDWCPTLARVVEDCGYECLCTSYPGVNSVRTDRYRLYRMPIRQGMTSQTIGNYLRFSISREIVRYRLLELPKRIMGIENYARFRRFVLGDRSTKENVEAIRGAGRDE